MIACRQSVCSTRSGWRRGWDSSYIQVGVGGDGDGGGDDDDDGDDGDEVVAGVVMMVIGVLLTKISERNGTVVFIKEMINHTPQ